MRNRFFKWLSKFLYNDSLIWRIKTKDNEVFITFDDGPTKLYTDRILEVLDLYNVKATFFCLGNNVEKLPDLFNKIVDSGHSIGNHGFEHLNGWQLSKSQFIDNCLKGKEIIKSDLFRPPYGAIKPSQAKSVSNSFKIVMWSIMSKDYNNKISSKDCLNRLKKLVRPGDIIVFHDSESASETTLKVLPEFLKFINDQGFKASVIK